MDDQVTMQAVVVTQAAIDADQATERLALFNEAGTPVGYFTEEAVTGADVLLTGLVAGTAVDVAATDTANEAIAKLQAQNDVQLDGSDVLLTGLAAGAATTILATDTVNQAMAKLQAQIDALGT